MSTNSTESVTQPPGASRGRWLLLAAGLVLLGVFVLPWLRFVIIADQRVALSLTGLQATTIGVVETTDGGLLYRSSFWLFLAPLAGAVGLALGALNLFPGRSAPWQGLLALLVSVASAVAVWGAFAASQEVAHKEKVAVEAQWGLSLAFLALLLLLAGGLILLREASGGNPPSAPRSTLSTSWRLAPCSSSSFSFCLPSSSSSSA